MEQNLINFINNHPLPPPSFDMFWDNVLERLRAQSGLNIDKIRENMKLDIVQGMYKNLLDKAYIIKKGKELNKYRKHFCMATNLTILSIAMDEMNDTGEDCLNQLKVIEQWWDGIGKWRA